MLKLASVPPGHPGARRPAPGPRTLAVLLLASATASTGCGDDGRTRVLPPAQVAMNPDTPAVFKTDEMKIIEVKKGLEFPILAPDRTMPAGSYGPYDTEPWVKLEDVRVQISWTISNLDKQPHNVELLIDPWTEFGRYWPGLTLVDPDEGKYLPNLSGIDHYYQLASAEDGDKSRVNGTYTYDDCDELARDFATVMNLIKNPPTSEPGGQPVDPANQAALLPTYVNHAFDFENLSNKDPLVKQWVPSTVAGLTGIDFGLRAYEPSTIALEIVVEVTDQGNDKVRESGSDKPLLAPTTTIITVGTSGPAM
jgi:hypothetical protein